MGNAPNALVLEILRQNQQLAMGIFEQKGISPTLRHYSQSRVSFREINKFCEEAAALLNRTSRRPESGPQAIKELKKIGQLLWDHLLTLPVKDRLKSTIIKDLVLSLDEEFINIPWELLYDGENFLCLKFNIGRLIRTSHELRPVEYRSPAGPLKMLILANPTADLKSAYSEGIYIKNQLDRRRSEIRIDFKSSHIDTLYVKKNLRDYDIVHFAGHCEYDSARPEESGWVLDNGRFTVNDIKSLAESSSLPALVFSNACHSAAVAPQDLIRDYQERTYGVASAFLFAGTMHYIGAMRRIEDDLSLLFAREFYGQLIKGEKVGECVRQARLKLIKERGIGAIGWVSYILYGDPNFALFKPRPRPAAPLLKFKRRVSSYRKQIFCFLLAIALISAALSAWFLAPSINPGTYFLFNRARNLYYQGNNQGTILFSNRIIQKEPLFLDAYPLLADAYRRTGRREEALKTYFDYVLSSQKRHNNKHLFSAYTSIGWVYQLSGDYPRARDFYNRALILSREGRDKLNEAVTLRKIAVCYIDEEEYDKALELLTKSSEINRQRQRILDYRANLARDYFDIGLVFANKDDYETAKDFYRKSQALFEKMKFRNELSDCYFNLGEIYLYEKQYQKALEYYLKGLRIDELQQNRASIAADYNMLGELYLEIGDTREAENFFNKAVLLSREINARVELAEAYHNLGVLYRDRRDEAKSREFLRLSEEIRGVEVKTKNRKSAIPP